MVQKKLLFLHHAKMLIKQFVFGVNEMEIKKEDSIISAASCTTTVLAR